MNNKAMGETIKDIASSIANSKWGKAIIPTTDELNKTIIGNSKLSDGIYTRKIQDALGSTLQSAGVPQDASVQIAKKIDIKNYKDSIDTIADDISQYTDKPVDKIIQAAKNTIDKRVSTPIDKDDITTMDKVLKYPQAYLMNPDKNMKNTRIATLAGTYVGATVGNRFLSGGTLTHDSYGKKDIAGIPFI
jgi:actin-like ATPase involved in cell morphogenesis